MGDLQYILPKMQWLLEATAFQGGGKLSKLLEMVLEGTRLG